MMNERPPFEYPAGGEDAPFSTPDRVRITEIGVLPRAIILAPTRELASQIHLEARKICFGSDIKTVTVYGGADIRAQLVELSTGCDLVVATPGRLTDLVDRGIISLSQVEFLILDEADRMLDMGFEVGSYCLFALVAVDICSSVAAPNSPNRAGIRYAGQKSSTDVPLLCHLPCRNSDTSTRISARVRLDWSWSSWFHRGQY